MENKKITYSQEFQDALRLAKENNFYLGEGNPNAKILIIGKECAIENRTPESIARQNIESWVENVKVNTQIQDIPIDPSVDNPLYPHRGQKFKVRRRKKRDMDVFVGDDGTAATWYYYQKLMNSLIPIPNLDLDINFHEYVFQSELSQINAMSSNQANETEKSKSIKERVKLFSEPFFQNFPIVIMAVSHYPKLYDFDIENVFNVKWNGESNKISAYNWYNINKNEYSKSPKLVIHTRQFSNGVSDVLINKIVGECKRFIDDNNIKL